MDHGTLVLNSVVDACKGWGLAEYMTQTEFLLTISGAPGQTFEIGIEDDRDEVTLWIDAAHFHTHFDQSVSTETVIQAVKSLLTGDSVAQARYRGKKWVESRVSGDIGVSVGIINLNPFLRLLTERIETLENKVILP